jgi:N-acetylglucosamine kinase-like BadF-type ATPase
MDTGINRKDGEFMKYFLGIDVGSSKTHALIVDETGQCVGFGKSGGGNHQNVGYERLAEVLQESFARAREMSGVDVADIAGTGFGVAGYDFPSDREPHLQAIASLGLPCPMEVVNDGMNGLWPVRRAASGSMSQPGHPIIAAGAAEMEGKVASLATALYSANMAARMRSPREGFKW